MPCKDDYATVDSEMYDLVVRVACDALTHLDRKSINLQNVVSKETYDWWIRHQEIDRKRNISSTAN